MKETEFINVDDHLNLKGGIDAESISQFSKKAIRCFFHKYGLTSHQIDSYNDFVSTGLQNLYDSLAEVHVEPNPEAVQKEEDGIWRSVTIRYGKVSLDPPAFWAKMADGEEEELKLLPKHARIQHMTYSARLRVRVKLQIFTKDSARTDKTNNRYAAMDKKLLVEEEKEIVMGRIPVMVGSKLCWLQKLKKRDCLFDIGGYFLIKGTEKTFISQEKQCTNRLWVYSNPWAVAYLRVTKREKIYIKLTESTKENGNVCGRRILIVDFLYTSMSVWILFFALGASSDKEVFEMIDLDLDKCSSDVVNILQATIERAEWECPGFRGGGKALEHLHNMIKQTTYPPSETIEECIKNYLFASVSAFMQKAFFLGNMMKHLLLAFSGKRTCEDKNDFKNKRLALVGDLLAQELKMHVRHAERSMKKTMQKDLCGDKDLQFIERYFDASIITNGLTRAFATGTWCNPSNIREKCSGIVANLRRTNPLQMISDLRKTRQQVAYAGKAGDARYPNPSFWGKLCFLSTPDGENCGLVKNLSVTAVVSTNWTEPVTSSTQFKAVSYKAVSTMRTNSIELFLGKLSRCGMELLENVPVASLSVLDKVFLNGDWIGACEDSKLFTSNLRSLRQKRMIHPLVEIKRDNQHREVHIFSDSGRILRPLLIVENFQKIKNLNGHFSFETLLNEEIVEFIGVEEEEDCLTAWGPRYVIGSKGEVSRHYTHCELDLSLLLGLSCSVIPFANHNFARRVLYQSEKHSLQAIGYSTTNPSVRLDTLSHQMYYPQKPLFRTVVSDCLGKPEIFNGQVAIVAVNVHLGYNQEDSIVVNKASLERGMFRTEHYRSYKSEVDNKEIMENRRMKPKDAVSFGKTQSKLGRIDSLDEDGFPFIGASLKTDDIIIGKVAESGADHGMKLKHTEKGVVHKVVLSANDEGKNFAAVTLRQIRSPCLGDKFSSMHGQKGVIGFLESQENFPFNLQGIVPDIVINPHAFPTRQTPGQLLEAALGKRIACVGSARYATPFTTPSIDAITDQLHSAGFSRWGGERLCNGFTGEMMETLIFMGPNFYQRLHHMAEDKIKYRNRGPVHPLTRQPVVDRKRYGGVKFGEMERDCLLAHGAAANLRERLFILSDFSEMHVCRVCQRYANVTQLSSGKGKVRAPYCQFCESMENTVKVDVPYGAKLLFQELFSMGINLKFKTEIE